MNQTETPFAHHTFAPWAVDGDRRVVAAQHEWDDVLKINEETRLREGRTRVLVDVDVFENYEHVMRNEDEMEDWGQAVIGITMHDTRDRLFRLIDSTPNLDWLLVTSRPENVERMMQNQCPDGRKGCEVLHVRHNLWLGVRVSNQHEADSRIQQLLRVPAAVRFVLCELTGAVSFGMWFDPTGTCCGAEAEVQCRCKGCLNLRSFPRDENGLFSEIDWVIVSGESGPDARPTHPDWVRGVRDRCRAAGIAFCFESWGDWAVREHLPKGLDEAESLSNIGYWDRNRWETGITSQRDVQYMVRVGSDRSGRLLDGREWNELPNQQQGE